MKRLLLRVLATAAVIAAGLVTSSSVASPAGATTDPPITPVADQIGRSFSAGREHACAIRRDATVWCWGRNNFGQIGADNMVGTPAPPHQVDLGGHGAVGISVGQGSSCAVLDDASLRCWGRNVAGELGNASNTNSPAPVNVDLPGTVLQVAVGNAFACALTGDQQVYCWGSNSNGRLGLGDSLTLATNEPTAAIALSQGAVSIAAYGNHACAVLADGTVGCWGENGVSEVGPGTSPYYAPYEFAVDDLCGAGHPILLGCSDPPQAVSVSIGLQTICALMSDHRVLCMGDNYYGERTSAASGRKSEVHLAQADIDAGRYVVQLALGWKQTCALLDDASVRCWGTNDSGVTGTATGTGVVAEPTAVDLGANAAVMALSASQSNTCALLTSGAIQCWGTYANGVMANSVAFNVGDDETPGSIGPVAPEAPGVATRSFTATGTTQAEGDGPGTVHVTVHLNEALPWPETVTYNAPGGQTGTLSFPVGTTSADFTIAYTGSSAGSTDRTIDVAMTAAPMPWPSATLTITLTHAADLAAEPFPYWLLDSSGKTYAFGGATSYGDATSASTAVDFARHGNGYWILLADGTVKWFGDATFQAPIDTSNWVDGERAVAIMATPTGDGYWVVTSRGRVQGVGDAVGYGDVASLALNAPIVDAVPTANGYYLLGADGGVFAFGNVGFYGSTASMTLNAPVKAIAVTDHGYWLTAADGGVFAYGDATFHGSMGGLPLNAPVTAMITAPGGYILVARDGGVFNFSTAPFGGSLGANPPTTPVIAVTA